MFFYDWSLLYMSLTWPNIPICHYTILNYTIYFWYNQHHLLNCSNNSLTCLFCPVLLVFVKTWKLNFFQLVAPPLPMCSTLLHENFWTANACKSPVMEFLENVPFCPCWRLRTGHFFLRICPKYVKDMSTWMSLSLQWFGDFFHMLLGFKDIFDM